MGRHMSIKYSLRLCIKVIGINRFHDLPLRGRLDTLTEEPSIESSSNLVAQWSRHCQNWITIVQISLCSELWHYDIAASISWHNDISILLTQ
jgi:hypothetical protein